MCIHMCIQNCVAKRNFVDWLFRKMNKKVRLLLVLFVRSFVRCAELWFSNSSGLKCSLQSKTAKFKYKKKNLRKVIKSQKGFFCAEIVYLKKFFY